LEKENPVLRHISQYRPYDRTQILRRDKAALYVHFPVSSSIIAHDFRNNAATLDRIVDITRQITADSTSQVKCIQIIGLASIEGGKDANERLSKKRANALKDYVQQHIATPDSIFEVIAGGEAWADFRDQLVEVQEAGGEQGVISADELEQAIKIIDNEPDETRREQQLRRVNGGKTWKYLKKNILADQRNSGYIRVYYDYVPDTAAAIINEASELLQTDCGECHHKALKLLEGVRDDQRAQNALGVALYLCGNKQEALEHFRRAAENGNEDAAKNLKEIERTLNRE
jgi:tetratricopeptide (TPR) repeat protein